MSKKKFEDQYLEDNYGPMNSVSKEDAEVWTNLKHSHETEEQQNRIKVAKKQKAKRSSVKQDRKISKEIIKHIGE